MIELGVTSRTLRGDHVALGTRHGDTDRLPPWHSIGVRLGTHHVQGPKDLVNGGPYLARAGSAMKSVAPGLGPIAIVSSSGDGGERRIRNPA